MRNHCENDRATWDEQELDVLIAETLSRIDRCEPVDVDQLVESYPEYADDLRSFFSISQELGEMMGARTSSRVGVSTMDQGQRSTTSLDGITIPLVDDLPYVDEAVPAKIGKYEVQVRLGSGSFGRVFKAFDPVAHRPVAIKVPKAWSEVSEEQQRAYIHEAQCVAALRHEHIVRLLDPYQGEDVPIALVYEYIDGPSLETVLKERNCQRSEAVGWIAQIADALHYAHKRNRVHRDIKPSNILLAECDGHRQPRVVDFGLALLGEEFWRKGDRCRVGAIRYMSPEQAKGNSHWATAQSDVFSLGVILYEVLCGQSPWGGDTDSAMLREIQERDPQPPRALDESIPEELERICLKALAKSPAERYTTAADMARDLRAAMRRETAPRRRRWLPLAAAVLGAVAVAAGLLWQPRIPPQAVQLDVRFQPNGQAGASYPLDKGTSELHADDGVQVNARVETPGYLYCLWYRPDGMRVVGEADLSAPRPAIQDPPVSDEFRWDQFGAASIGENLLVAFTKPTPLTESDLERLKTTAWRTPENSVLGEQTMKQVGWPNTPTQVAGVSRGESEPQLLTGVRSDRWLGELGTLLKDEWECYYRGIIFRVEK